MEKTDTAPAQSGIQKGHNDFVRINTACQYRVVEALQKGACCLEDVDRIAGASNGPEVVRQLRELRWEILCKLVAHTDQDGKPCQTWRLQSFTPRPPKSAGLAYAAKGAGGGRTNITCMDGVRQFADAVYRDIGAVIHPEADGDLHRFDDPEGKHNNEACWYVLHLDGIPAGAYGNWRTGYQSTWRADTRRELDPAERARIDAVVRTAKAKRDRERLDNQADAARRASMLWRDAVPATVDHPYLARWDYGRPGIYCCCRCETSTAIS